MSVSTLRKSNTLDKLLAQVQSESAPQEKKSYVDERLSATTLYDTQAPDLLNIQRSGVQ